MGRTRDNDNGALAFMGAFLFADILIVCAILAFSIWVYWRILSRAGFNGALALLMLIPLGGLVPILMLAFGRWPIEDQLAALRSGQPLPPVNPNPFAGPPMVQ